MKTLILAAATISLVVNSTLIQIVKGINNEAFDWMGVPEDKFEEAFKESNLQQHANEVQVMIQKLEIMNVNMTAQSLQFASKSLSVNAGLVASIKKYLSYSWTTVEFLEQKKKLKQLRSFALDYPKYSENIFDSRNNDENRGKRIGLFFKGFLEWYYVTILSESSTLSTVLMRALTAHTDVMSHKDLSFCIDLQSVGELCQKLENMDINSVFLKVPAVFNVLRHLKLKQKCQNQQNRLLIRNLSSKLEGINMFRYMYENYEPYVDIATEKYGITKVKMLARNFASMIDNSTNIIDDQLMRPSPLQNSSKNEKKDQSSSDL